MVSDLSAFTHRNVLPPFSPCCAPSTRQVTQKSCLSSACNTQQHGRAASTRRYCCPHPYKLPQKMPATGGAKPILRMSSPGTKVSNGANTSSCLIVFHSSSTVKPSSSSFWHLATDFCGSELGPREIMAKRRLFVRLPAHPFQPTFTLTEAVLSNARLLFTFHPFHSHQHHDITQHREDRKQFPPRSVPISFFKGSESFLQAVGLLSAGE